MGLLRRLGGAIGLAPRPRITPPPQKEAGPAGARGGSARRHTRVVAGTSAAAGAPAPSPNGANAGQDGRATAGVPKEILKQVRLIEMRTRGMVRSLFSGEYLSVFKWQGMEFAEVREYQPGDDVRNIEWNVTARMGHPYIKKYVEERELTVLLAVDLSG